uniref:Uncharacterized protein n=1 Tax=Fagus sylvatica TaxID=28930 RepID=A0A2N9FY96_FAGSY
MMAGGVESWSSSSAEGEAKLGMVMEFSLDDGGVAAASFSSSPKLPRRLRRRLSESKTPQEVYCSRYRSQAPPRLSSSPRKNFSYLVPLHTHHAWNWLESKMGIAVGN